MTTSHKLKSTSTARHKIFKILSILAALIIFCSGIGLGYVVYETERELKNASWVSAPATITYTYSFQLKGGKTSANFTPQFLEQASYVFTANDGKKYSGHDSQAITGSISTDLVSHGTTVTGKVLYDQNDPNSSYVFPADGRTEFFSWFCAVILVAIGIAMLRSSLRF